jgi:hypothetical protein
MTIVDFSSNSLFLPTAPPLDAAPESPADRSVGILPKPATCGLRAYNNNRAASLNK